MSQLTEEKLIAILTIIYGEDVIVHANKVGLSAALFGLRLALESVVGVDDYLASGE